MASAANRSPQFQSSSRRRRREGCFVNAEDAPAAVSGQPQCTASILWLAWPAADCCRGRQIDKQSKPLHAAATWATARRGPRITVPPSVLLRRHTSRCRLPAHLTPPPAHIPLRRLLTRHQQSRRRPLMLPRDCGSCAGPGLTSPKADTARRLCRTRGTSQTSPQPKLAGVAA